jgi:hypothetical protein
MTNLCCKESVTFQILRQHILNNQQNQHNYDAKQYCHLMQTETTKEYLHIPYNITTYANRRA